MGLGWLGSVKVHEFLELFKTILSSNYCTHAIISRGLYMFCHIFEDQFFVKKFFNRKICPDFCFVIKSGFIMARVGSTYALIKNAERCL